MAKLGVFITLLAGVLLASCQQAAQPSDLTATRTMMVEVRSHKGVPLADATVFWERITGLNAPASGIARTGEDGFSSIVISEVSTQRDSVRISVDPPNVEPFIGVGATEITTSICVDTLLSVSFSPLIVCAGPTISDTIVLEACPENGRGFARLCRYYPTTCPPGLVYTASANQAQDITITTRSTQAQQSTLELCAEFTPNNAQVADQTLLTTIIGTEPTSGAVQFRLDLVVDGKINCTPCPCPVFKAVDTTTPTLCIGLPTEFEVEMDSAGVVSGLGADCVLELELKSVTNNDQVKVISDENLTLRNGQLIPPVELEITGRDVGVLESEIRYRMRTRRLSNDVTEECETDVVLRVDVPLAAPQCRVTPTNTDTLEKCVFNDNSTTDTVFLVNDGGCEAVYNVTTTGTFSASPSGTVTVPAGSRQQIVVVLTASKRDWDNNQQPPSGGRGKKTFTGTLRISGCAEVSIPLVGEAYVQCSAFKFQCLREFRPQQFPNVYAESIELVEDRTNIVYQNDNQSFRRYDLWIDEIIDNGGGNFEVTLGSGDPDNGYSEGRFIRVASGFFINPGENICETFPAAASITCTNAKSNPGAGSPTLSGVVSGDVILFVKNDDECALLWIQKVDLDRDGGTALPAACMEICYPMFTLP